MADITKIDTFIQSSPHPSWLATTQGHCVYANPALERLTGFNSDQINQADWRSFLLEEDRAVASASWQRSLASGTPYREQVRMRGSDGAPECVELIAFGHKAGDGTELWLFTGLDVNGVAAQKRPEFEAQLQTTLNVIPADLDRGVPLRDEDGKIVKWYGVVTDIEDRKRAEETLGVLSRDLQESNAKLEAAQRITHVGYWERDLATDRITWSDETYRIFGLRPQEDPIDLAALRQKIHPEDWEYMSRALDEALGGGTRYDIEYRVLRPTGELRIVRSTGDVKRDASGRPYKMFGTVQDITDRKRAEEALRASEESFRLIVHSIPGLVNTTTATGEIDLANQQLLDYVGKTLEELQDWRPLVHPDDRGRAITLWSRSIETGHEYDDEHRLRRADGLYRWFHIRALPLRDKEGRIIRWYVLSTDIDDRKRAEEALGVLSRDLQESNAKLEAAQRITHVGYWEWDILTGRVNWSDETYRIYGLRPQERPMDIATCQEKIHPEDWQRGMEEALGGDRFNAECRLFRPTGEVRIAHFQGEVKRDASGQPYQMFGTVQDITDRKRAEEALQQSKSYLAEGQRLAHMGSWAFNAAGFEYWSSELFRIHGLDPSGKPPTVEEYLALVHPEDRAFMKQGITNMLADHRAFDFTKRIVRPDGEIRRIRCVGIPVMQGGTFQGFHGTGMDVTDQERLTEELRLSERYLSEGQRLAHMGSWALNPSGVFEYWSQELFKIYGLDPQKAVPTLDQYLATLHPQDRDSMADTIKRMHAEHSGCDAKKRIVRPDGEQRYIRCVGIPVVEGEVFKGFLGTAIDITEQELLTQELRRREAYLAEAQRLSQTGSFGWRPDSGEIVWSDETYRIFEYDPAVKPTIDLVVQRVHPEDRPDFLKVIESASAGATQFEHTYRLMLPDGSVQHVHALARALQDASGNREFVGAATDVTSIKRAEEELRKSEAYLAEAQRLSQTGSWAWSPDQDIRYWSEECYRVLSFDPQDGLPRFEEFFQRIHPDDQPGFRELIQTAIREKAEWEADYRIVHPDGPVRDIHVVGHPVLSTSGHLVEFVGTVIDVTERNRAEALRDGESRILEMIARDAPLQEILENMVRVVEAQFAGLLCSVLLLDEDGQHVRHAAAPSLPELYIAAIEGLSIGPNAGSCGTAMYRGEPVVVTDTLQDPLWESYRAVAEPHGLRACWSTPILAHSGKVLGSFAMYYREPRSPSPSENRALEMATHLTGIAIERKLTRERLQRSEAYLAEAQKLTHTASWAWRSADRKTVHLSEEFYRIYGFDPAEGAPTWEEYLERVHPEDRLKWTGTIERAIAEKADYDQEFRILLPNGMVKWIRTVGHPVLSDAGDLEQFVGSSTDITERKHAEEALRSSEAYLVEAQRRTHTGSCAIDGTSRETVYWSDEMFRLFGFDPQQGLPMFDQWLQRIHPEDRDKMKAASEKTFLTKVNCDVQFRIVKSDGTVKHIHGIGHPVLSATGELVQVLGTMVDVTESKRAEEARDRLRQLEAELAHINRVSVLGEMAASVAHEIKQPIAAAITSANSCIEWLAHEPPNLDRARAAAARIDKYGNRAAEIIDRIRSFYRKAPPQRELVDVNGIIHEMLTLLNGEACRFSVAMRTDLSAELPKIMVDRVQLQQVFMNLMLNAIEAMEDSGGELTVKSELQDGQLQFSVSDTGVGLPAGSVDQIFSAFFTTKPQGSGMGLAISRSIVESHGGRLWAAANGRQGATFSFTLPIQVTESSPLVG
jgi:PAS domain S-box-containing protein